MLPTGATPSDRSAQDTSRLGQVPKEIKQLILNCLGVKGAATAATVNVLWQKIGHQPTVWQGIAKQMKIPIMNPQNAEFEVKDFCLYHAINEVFNTYVEDPLKKQLETCKSEADKYNVVLEYYKSISNHYAHPFIGFLSDLRHDQTAVGVQAAKKMIQDGVLSTDPLLQAGLTRSVGASTSFTPPDFKKANLDIFKVILEKMKKQPFSDILLEEVVREVSQFSPSFAPFLQVALEAGGKPNLTALENASRSSNFSVNPPQVTMLKLVLDYCDDSVRKEVLERLLDNEMRTEPDDLGGETEEDVKNRYSALRQYIENAPPPTYGKKDKSKEPTSKESPPK